MVLAIILETAGIYRGLRGGKTRLMMASVALALPFLVSMLLFAQGAPAAGSDSCTGDIIQPLFGFYLVAFSLIGMLVASVLFDMIRYFGSDQEQKTKPKIMNPNNPAKTTPSVK